MTTTSKKQFPDNFRDEVWKPLLANFKKFHSKEDVIEGLKTVLTKNELNILEKRLAVRYLLSQGLNHRQISEIVDVQRNTVVFIKKGFVRNKKVNPQRETKERKSGLEALIEDFGLAKGGSDFPKYRFTRRGARR